MKRPLSWMGLFGVFIVTAAFGQILLAPSANAIEDPDFNWVEEYTSSEKLGEKQLNWCDANLNNETVADISTYRTGSGGTYVNNCLDSSKGGICTIDGGPDEEEFICVRDYADGTDLDEDEKIIRSNESKYLQELYCGVAGNQQNADRLLPCYRAVKEAYETPRCYYRNQRDYTAGYNTTKYAAPCVYQALRGNDAIVNRGVLLTEVKAAIRKAKKESNQQLQQAGRQEVARQQCLNDGGEWIDDACVLPEDSNGTTCNIEGIGWLICPVVRTIASFNDALFGLLETLLNVNASMFDTSTGGGKATFQSWSAVRDIANVAFVVAFMVIVYSQLTSVGVSNYGIKKLLPRIVVAAILVNMSFIICAIAVDLSNIAGSSLHELLINATRDLGDDTGASLSVWDKLTSWLLAGGVGVLAVGGATLAVGAYGPLGALALLIPLAVIALIAALTVVFVLIARQAFVIILVVVAPLAFVAYLLPNTESWFSKWRKAFVSMLLIYPMVALLFGGSQLASAVIRAGADDALVFVLSLVVLVLPLFATPLLIKFSGGLIGRIAGVMNNPNKGPFDRLKKGGARYAERKRGFKTGQNVERTQGVRDGSRGKAFGATGTRRRRAAAWLSGIGNTNRMDSAEQDKYAKIASDGTARNYVATRAYADPEYAAKLAGGDASMVPDIQAYSKQAVHEEDVKDVKAQRVLISHTGIDELLERTQNKNLSKSERTAAVIEVAERGGHQHVQKMYDYLMTEGKAGSKDISQIQELSAEALLRRKPAGVGATTANALRSGTMKGDGVLAEFAGRIEAGKFDYKALAGMDVDDHVRIAELAESGRLDDTILDQIRDQLKEIKESDSTSITPEQQRVLEGALGRQAPKRKDDVTPLLVELTPIKATTSPSPEPGLSVPRAEPSQQRPASPPTRAEGNWKEFK